MTVTPLYTIHQYRADMFKIIAFKGRRDPDAIFLHSKDEDNHYDTKLDNAFSRARSMVLQYALCNPWEYFFTGTLDPDRWDRADLDTFMVQLSQAIRDWRKDYGFKVDVLLVPEHHADGHWHVHGLINNLPSWCLYKFHWLPLGWLLPMADPADPPIKALFPFKLCEREDWRYWGDFADKFGYCSLAPIRDPIATAFYISKYVSKDLSRRAGDLGKHLYFHSRPLKKAENVSNVYFPNPGLDGLCTHEYDFCKTGMVENAPWYFPYTWDGAEWEETPLIPPPMADPLEGFEPGTVEPPQEVWEQMSLLGG